MTTIESMTDESSTDLVMQPGAGNLGLTRRSYERLYYNAPQALSSVDYFVNRMAPWAEDHVSGSTEHRRVVGRILITERQLSETLERSLALQNNIEVAIPVGEYNGNPMMMVMWGINNSEVRTLVDISHIVRQTEYPNPPETAPHTRIEALRDQGYRFVDSADEITTQQILSLWGPIFEWQERDIDGLRTRLQTDRLLPPSERSVWFTAVMHGSDVVSLAMAERLNLPLGMGDSIPVIESTEWCVQSEWQQKGLGIGAVTHVHAQAFRDLEHNFRQPIVLAETNFTSRADRIGHGAGMVVGSHEFDSFFVPQVLRQNVAVGDGLRPDRLRDFTMMYIPPDHIEQYYSSVQCAQITGGSL